MPSLFDILSGIGGGGIAATKSYGEALGAFGQGSSALTRADSELETFKAKQDFGIFGLEQDVAAGDFEGRIAAQEAKLGANGYELDAQANAAKRQEDIARGQGTAMALRQAALLKDPKVLQGLAKIAEASGGYGTAQYYTASTAYLQMLGVGLDTVEKENRRAQELAAAAQITLAKLRATPGYEDVEDILVDPTTRELRGYSRTRGAVKLPANAVVDLTAMTGNKAPVAQAQLLSGQSIVNQAAAQDIFATPNGKGYSRPPPAASASTASPDSKRATMVEQQKLIAEREREKAVTNYTLYLTKTYPTMTPQEMRYKVKVFGDLIYAAKTNTPYNKTLARDDFLYATTEDTKKAAANYLSRTPATPQASLPGLSPAAQAAIRSATPPAPATSSGANTNIFDPVTD